ncbi:hypothetical protein CBL_00795 [Carabus blaptoides fortunei]
MSSSSRDAPETNPFSSMSEFRTCGSVQVQHLVKCSCAFPGARLAAISSWVRGTVISISVCRVVDIRRTSEDRDHEEAAVCSQVAAKQGVLTFNFKQRVPCTFCASHCDAWLAW